MAYLAFDPTIPVFDRHAKSYPKHATGEPATYGPFSEACTTVWGWDAHFAAYAAPTVERRLGTHAALALKPKMVLLVLDIDGPEHKCPPEWWALEKEKVRALFKAHGRGYCYTTRGGYRVVFALRDELELDTPAAAMRWRVSYLDWIAKIQTDFGIVCDDKCSDWTRCFRLPRVTRDNVANEPADEIGEPNRMLQWSEPYCAPDDPRILHTSHEPFEIPEPAPVEDTQLESAARALADAWPKRNRHYAGLALCGALGRAGWSEEAIIDFVAGVFCLANGGDPWFEEAQASARSTLDKISRNEPVAGWDSLVEHLTSDLNGQPNEAVRPTVEAAVLTTRRALGQGPAIELFTQARAAKSVPMAEQFAAALAAGDPAVRLVAGNDRFMTLLNEAAVVVEPAFARASKVSVRDVKEAKRMFMTFEEMLARDVPPPEFLAKNLITKEGVGAISGEPKSGKSWDLMHIALCLASGRSVFGRFEVPNPVGAVYFSIEDTEAAVKNRFRAIASAMSPPLVLEGDWVRRLIAQPRGRELDVCSVFDMCVFVASIWMLEEEKGVKVRFAGLDPLSDVHGKKEDSRDDMAVVMAHFRALARILTERAGEPVVVAFVHHSSKSNADNKDQKRGGQKMRGSSAIHGAVDWGVYETNLRGDGKSEFIARLESEVKAARGGGLFDRTLLLTDNDNGNAVTATWSTAEPDFGDKETPSKDMIDQVAVSVVGKLFAQNAPMVFEDLKRKIGGRKEILRDALQVAQDEGWVSQKMHGGRSLGYEITEKGRGLIRSGGSSGAAEGGSDPPPAKPDPALSGFQAVITSSNN